MNRSWRRVGWLDRLPIWLTGVTLSTALIMIVGLIGFITVRGLRVFWPVPLWDVRTTEGQRYLGLIHTREVIPHQANEQGRLPQRILLRIGNRDLLGNDFVWVDDSRISSWTRPLDAVVIDRLEWGPFYGFVKEVRVPDRTVGAGGDEVWRALVQQLPSARRRYRMIRRIERRTVGDISTAMEQHRLAMKRLNQRRSQVKVGVEEKLRHHEEAMKALEAQYAVVAEKLDRWREQDAAFQVILASIDGKEKVLPISSLVRAYRPNHLSWVGRLLVYLDRSREFVFGQPREANSEGGVAPAIFGTVMMTLLMSLAVVPFGVLAALYLHEYAKQGVVVSIVRIAVNNLAGVPSIVFGVFGLGFFCYLIGGTIDQIWFSDRLPTPTVGGGGILWASLTLALLTVPVVIVATEEALAAVPNRLREASLACGATKFQTICRVVLPAAVPGVLTGMVLAMARGAGEVAPLMITGVVKLAPELPIDHQPLFIHLERKFMHLGFHIYDVGFQSPNVEASKAMVYMTTVLLLAIIVCLNLSAMRIRARLREQLQGGEV